MKLSTAIRKGAKLDGKQHFGELFLFDQDEQDEQEVKGIKGCCALGAAIIGKVGIKKASQYDYADLNNWFPKSDTDDIELPKGIVSDGGLSRMSVQDAVIVLNDEQKWSRARIATWLEKHGY